MNSYSFATILCPVDFSEISAHALRTASLLAACGNATLVAAYANWFEAPPYFTEARIEGLEREIRESVQAAQQSLADFVKDVLGERAAWVETRVVDGLPADGVRAAAERVHADLIVMGTHGRGGLNRWMLGSVAERVVRESSIPVLTVRSEPRWPIRRVLCPVHDTPASRQALRMAAGLSACLRAELTVLHVLEASGDKALALCDWIPAEERARCTTRELVRHGDAAEEIIKVAAEEPFDLLVIGAAKRSFFEGMVLGTTTIRAVRHAPCPVLTVGAGLP
jgi:nucleotide-binding universal stress UspA family protein